jgi:DNA polymerase III epsilon subunit-like protein
MNGHALAAIDCETTGADPHIHEVCQIGIVLLDCHMKPYDEFYTDVRPKYPTDPEAMAVHGLTHERLEQAPDRHSVADSLWEFFQNQNLIPGKRFLPLCHNAPFDMPFIQRFLGLEMYHDVFSYPQRDTQSVVAGIIDKAAFNGVPCMFKRTGLKHVCEVLGITIEHHDALSDALATGELYKKLLTMGQW